MVWIFLDSASNMALGTTVKNTLEYAIQAALGLTHFYLSRECRVGICIYDYDAHEWEGAFLRKQPEENLHPALSSVNQIEEVIDRSIESEIETTSLEKKPKPKKRVIFPDMGRRQQFKITREMLNVDISYSEESLKQAVHSCRGHIFGTRPLFIIITMIDASKTQGLVDGIMELHKYSSRKRQRPAILIFNILGFTIAAQSEEEKIAAELLEYRNRPVYAALERLGATIVPWNPRNQSFTQALIKRRI